MIEGCTPTLVKESFGISVGETLISVVAFVFISVLRLVVRLVAGSSHTTARDAVSADPPDLAESRQVLSDMDELRVW